jgi:hypothetical protein
MPQLVVQWVADLDCCLEAEKVLLSALALVRVPE